jgi:type IV pilus secretin PilQ/predicted competence protein
MLSAKTLWRTAALMILLSLCLSLAGGAQEERIITSLTLQDADLLAVLRFLSEFSGRNIVASTGLKGTVVNVQLRDVTWREALEIIMEINHLAALEEEGYIRIMPIKELHGADLELQKYLQDKEDLIQLEHRILPVEHATAAEIRGALASVLSKRGRIDIDARTNSLIVTDVPENLDLMAQIVQELDQETPQITISAKLFEVDSKSLIELGIDWSVIKDREVGVEYPETDYERRAQQSTSGGLTEVIGRFTYSTVEQGIELDALLATLVSENKAEILAHPEITTLDNKEATILMGQEIPLKVLDEAGNVVTELTQVGTKLTVTPHVTAENTILLELEPERSSYEVDPGAGVIINTQRAKTSVVVSDGQTAVIGGLTIQDTKKSEKGLPLLKDIPLLGRLFKYTRDEVTKSDLIIFVTPRIVSPTK